MCSREASGFNRLNDYSSASRTRGPRGWIGQFRVARLGGGDERGAARPVGN